MILLLALGLAFGWGMVRGGNPAHLLVFPLRAYGLVLAAFGLQVLVVYVPLPAWLEGLRVPLLLLSYILLAGFVYGNRRLPGMGLIGAGLLANGLVMVANGGYMPVTLEALHAIGKGHLVSSPAVGARVFGAKDIWLPAEATRLWFLSDIFVLPPPFPIPSVFSIGDGLIALGVFRLIPFALGVAPQEPNIAGTESA